MSAEEDGDLLGAVVDLDFGKLLDNALWWFERLGLGGGGSPPDEDDEAADEDGDGGGEEHEEVAVLEEEGGGGGVGGGGDVGGVELALEDGGHEIQRGDLHGAGVLHAGGG